MAAAISVVIVASTVALATGPFIVVGDRTCPRRIDAQLRSMCQRGWQLVGAHPFERVQHGAGPHGAA